ncbi:unnamed protein product [Prorocentrum cordatum]|uniref:PDZ domain-containing protein n=1 Tax=Prorocentrum cordatum TaxID=2364126 RepID=A0ABN9WL98_9DINO|nr:unnamed protein product [Polarella glacialis]
MGSLLVVLAVPGRALVRLQTEAEVEADSEAIVSMSTLSTEEWEQAHEAAYEQTFTIELNMTAASQGVAIGAELWSRSDHDPLVVLKKSDVGLVENWNRVHPDKAVQVGDEIFMVGDFKWQHRNEMFVRHLKEQFGVLKGQKPGMASILELGIRRPKKAKKEQTESKKPEAPTDAQPPSRDAHIIEVEFDPTLAYTLVDSNFNSPTASDMTVSAISPGSPLYAYNEAHPTNQVHVGDFVTAVNGSPWSGNSMLFLKMLHDLEQSHAAGIPGQSEPQHIPLILSLHHVR